MVFKNRIKQRTMNFKEYQQLVEQAKKAEKEQRNNRDASEYVPIMIG